MTGEDQGDWLRLAPVHALERGRAVGVDIDGRRLAVFHTAAGFRAIDGYCLHAAGPLADGDLCKQTVRCPWHGWTYDLETGQRRDRRGQGLSVYRTRIDNEWLWLEVPVERD